MLLYPITIYRICIGIHYLIYDPVRISSIFNLLGVSTFT